MFRSVIALLAGVVGFGLASAPEQVRAETRIALVVGNGAYQERPLTTAPNDAGLIAQTLQAAGFDVVGARDLDQDALRRAFRDFLDKAANAGPDTVAVVYLNGYGLQLEGENYFAPIDARIARDTDVAAEALRLSDYTRPLAALNLKATVVVLDAARAHPFARAGRPLAGGLALVEPEPGMLIAFNAAPGTVAPEPQADYGPYAQALAEMMREGGLPLDTVFDRVRLRVNDTTHGAAVPWYASRIETPFVFFERAPDAPPSAAPVEQTAALRARPIRDFSSQEAYTAALERDTLEGYQDFLAAYPNDPMAARVRAIAAARREAITWRRTRSIDTPQAYWSYLRRYPHGPHAADAHRRLTVLAAAVEPPPQFAVVDYDVPPPPPEEIVYVERPVIAFDDPAFAFAPPPPPPPLFLAPPPPEFVVLPPPPPPVDVYVLPIPEYRPVPIWVRPPAYVAPPPNNVIYQNVHNTVIVSNVTNNITIRERSGRTRTIAPPAPPPRSAEGTRPGAPAPARAVVGPALPPSVAQKAAIMRTQPRQGAGAPAPGARLPAWQQRQLPSQQPQQGQLPQPGQPARPGQPPRQQQSLPVPGVSAPPARGQPPRRTLTQQPGQAGQPGQPLPNGAPARGATPKGTAQPVQRGAQPPAQPTQPGQPLPKGSPLPTQQQQRREAEQHRQQLLEQQRQQQQQRQQVEQQRVQQPQQRRQQVEQHRQQQQRPVEQQRQQQLQQQRQQAEQQRAQQLQQQRQQIEQQRQQQQRQQVDQQRQQQLQQQRQQVEQQRAQQLQQQRQQIEQQRRQQLQQQQQQQHRQQAEQQRAQQLQQLRQQQQQHRPQPQQGRAPCGGQGRPPCPR